jgi:hypothetical protein
VQCNVSGSSSALPMSINQCNGSANGGGSTVTCTSTVVNQFVTPVASATTTTSAGTGGAGTAASSGAGGAGSGSAGSGGSGEATTASAGGAGSTTGSATGVIPVGSPQTGEGGAARADGGEFMKLGELAMIGAALAVAVALRRRHLLIGRSRVSQR